MPFNINTGLFTPPAGATNAVTGQVIQSAVWNSIHGDISNALTGMVQGTQPLLPYNPPVLAGTVGTISTQAAAIINPSAAFALTLPIPSVASGRSVLVKSIANFTVSNNLANVVPLAGGAAGTVVLSASGKFALLACDGISWNIMAAN